MPSSFDSFSNGDPIEAHNVSEMHAPIQNLERGAAFYAGTSTGTSTAYAVTMSPAPDDPHQSGMIVNFKVHTNNSVGSPDVTLNVNSVGAKPILKDGGDSLVADDLKADQIVSVIYDASGSGAFNLIAVSGSSVVGLNDLSDVSISSPSSGQVVRYNGSNFANASLSASDMPSGIDAAKIGGGAVSNTEFGYLDGVTSALQTQLSGKASSSHTHAASDITSGQIALARGGTNADLSATGGTGQFLKQSSSGAAVTVGALAASDMPSGIDATKIGGGAVSNTEFGYLDGVTSALQTQINALSAQVPIGTVVPFAGSSTPSGWLLCYGQNVSRSTYSALFTALSTTYGSGDGSTTFGLPDLRGRVSVGKDNMGGSSANRFVNIVSGGTLGASGGTDRHQLQTSEIPNHTHSISLYATGGPNTPVIQGGWSNGYWNATSSQGAGGGGYHSNTQPSLVLNYIIYAGV